MKSDLDVRQLRALLATMEQGTVSRAAASLGLAQSTVSEALAALDRAVGAPVLVRRRGAQRLTLTPAGAALLPYARRILSEIDGAHVAVAQVARSASARLEVIANESITNYLLPAPLAALRKAWLRTSVAVAIGTCDDIRARVASGRCDLGVLLDGEQTRAGDATTMSPVQRVLQQDIPLVLFASPGHPLAGRARVVPREAVTEYPVFIADGSGDYYDLLRRYLGADGAKGLRLEPAGTIDAVRRGVATDHSALGMLPAYTLADDLKAGRVHAVRARPAPPTMQLVALLPARNAHHPAIAELLDALTGVG